MKTFDDWKKFEREKILRNFQAKRREISLYLDEDEAEIIEKMAESYNRSISEQVRKIILNFRF